MPEPRDNILKRLLMTKPIRRESKAERVASLTKKLLKPADKKNGSSPKLTPAAQVKR